MEENTRSCNRAEVQRERKCRELRRTNVGAVDYDTGDKRRRRKMRGDKRKEEGH